jgi:PKD repeat protein
MRNSVLSLIAVLCCSFLVSQAQVRFQQSYHWQAPDSNEISVGIYQEAGDEYLITSRTNSSKETAGHNFQLTRLDSTGGIQFSKMYGGAGADEVYSSVSTDGLYMVGYSGSGFIAGQFADAYVVKTDFQGNTQWAKSYTSTGIDFAIGSGMTSDSGIVVFGNNYDFISGQQNSYLLKLDQQGNIGWARHYGDTNATFGINVTQTSDGGYFYGALITDQGAGANDILIGKTDNTGTQQWARTIGGDTTESISAVIETADSNYLVAGTTESFGAGPQSIYLNKFDQSGNQMWAKTIGDTGTEGMSNIKQLENGDLLLTGSTNSFNNNELNDLLFLRTDSAGDPLWARTYHQSGSTSGVDFTSTSDGGWALLGNTSFGGNQANMYFAKTDSDTLTGCQEMNQLLTSTSVSDSVAVYAPGDQSVSVSANNVETGFVKQADLTRSITCHCASATFFDHAHGDSIIFFADSSVNANSWYWEFGDGDTSTLHHPDHTYDEYGWYEVCLTTQGNCGGNTKCDSILVTPCPPQVKYSYTVTDSTLTVDFTDSSVVASDWYWEFGDGNTSNQQHPQHTYEDTGKYEVCLTVTNSVCASATHCDSISVPTVTEDTSDNISEVGVSDLRIYPNPAEGHLMIESHQLERGEYQVQLFDQVGQRVYHRAHQLDERTRIDVSDLEPGVYYLNIEGESRAYHRKVFIY